MRLFKKTTEKTPPTPSKNPEPLKTDFRKLKLLVTVVNRNKTEFYLDYLNLLVLL